MSGLQDKSSLSVSSERNIKLVRGFFFIQLQIKNLMFKITLFYWINLKMPVKVIQILEQKINVKITVHISIVFGMSNSFLKY